MGRNIRTIISFLSSFASFKLQDREVKGAEKKYKSKGSRDNDLKVYTSITMERLLVNFSSNIPLVSNIFMAF
jgi:hypothetical protein